MEYTVLKNSDLRVSRICIGGDPMGGHAWGMTNDVELIEAVNVAIDSGINFFDTADVYGLGKAESLLGTSLKGKRDKVVVATKFGVRRSEDNSTTFYDNSPQWIRTALEGSLRRLQTDWVDILQIHYLDHKTPFEDIVGTLKDLKCEGKVRYFALSNVFASDISILKPYRGFFVSFQDQFSLACRDFENDIRELSSELHLTPLTWGSLGQGILTGKYGRDVVFPPSDRRSRPSYPNFHGVKLQKNIDIVDYMKSLCPETGKEPAAIAMRFILDYLSDSVVIVGVKRKDQVLSNCEACDWHLTNEQIDNLVKISQPNDE